jgi:large subunit ribosomal protein L25
VSTFVLQAEKREQQGSAHNRRLRRTGRVPAVIYGGGQEPLSVSLNHMALLREMEQEAFFTSILSLKIGNQTQPAVVKEVQRHPAKPQLLHLDFQRIVEDEEITLHVPIHFVGEAAARGVKEQGGVIEHLLTDVEVTCLPRYLPEYLELDVSAMELNQMLHLSDIPLPEGVTLVALSHQQDHPVVTVSPPRREEEEEGAEPAAAEVPTVAETKAPEEEGEES